MFIKTHEKAIEMASNYIAISKNDKKRLEAVNAMLLKNAKSGFMDAGIAGKVFEILARPSTSRLIGVCHNQQWSTCDSRYTVKGARVEAEIKTNGGRIGRFFTMTESAQYNKLVIYYMSIEQTGRKNKPDTFDDLTVCMPIADFLDILKSTKGALKIASHRGMDDDEIAIQKTMRVFKALKPYDVGAFDRNNIGQYF